MKNNKKISDSLEQALDNYVNPEILERLKNIQAMGLDPDLFIPFEKKVLSILEQNPGSDDIVSIELDKTKIAIEQAQNQYDRKFRSIIKHASNDDNYGATLSE